MIKDYITSRWKTIFTYVFQFCSPHCTFLPVKNLGNFKFPTSLSPNKWHSLPLEIWTAFKRKGKKKGKESGNGCEKDVIVNHSRAALNRQFFSPARVDEARAVGFQRKRLTTRTDRGRLVFLSFYIDSSAER